MFPKTNTEKGTDAYGGRTQTWKGAFQARGKNEGAPREKKRERHMNTGVKKDADGPAELWGHLCRSKH